MAGTKAGADKARKTRMKNARTVERGKLSTRKGSTIGKRVTARRKATG